MAKRKQGVLVPLWKRGNMYAQNTAARFPELHRALSMGYQAGYRAALRDAKKGKKRAKA